MDGHDGRISMVDPGAASLAFVLRLLGIAADPAEILHRSGRSSLDEGELLRAALRFPVKARAVSASFERLSLTPMPAVAGLADGGWLVLGGVNEDRVLVQDPASPTPQALSGDEFRARWSGR